MDPDGQAASALRRLPKVDEALAGPLCQSLLKEAPRWAVLLALRQEIAFLRQQILSGTESPDEQTATQRIPLSEGRLRTCIQNLLRPPLRPVLNATGVVLHTNLGRAPLAERALARIKELTSGYSNLEYRLSEGHRGSRHEHLASILAPLTGAEAHLVVNNNAAAVLLTLSALCACREVVVSRGELVEIGGSFRIPDVMRASGARLHEVGTTNRTHLADYEGALARADVAAFMKVHRSNFALLGFVKELAPQDLCRLAKERSVHSLCDLGSGALLSPQSLCKELHENLAVAGFGMAEAEPTVAETVSMGFDVVTFSCDKLLGGPQAGVIAGRKDLIQTLHKHPLMRALRPDKLTLAALLGTLEAYRDGIAEDEIPTLRMLATPLPELRRRAETFKILCMQALANLAQGVASDLSFSVMEVRSAPGGGTLPLSHPPSFAVVLAGAPARQIEAHLREGDPPLVARIENNHVVLDLRTLFQEELAMAARCVAAAFVAAQRNP